MNRDNLVLAVVVVIAFLCFLLGSLIPVYPEPLERWSGYEWYAMNAEQRTYYTAGLMTGLWFGARATKLAQEPEAKAAVERFFAQVAAFLDTHNLTQATAALDSFYLVGPKDVPIVFVLVEPQERSQ